MTSVGLTVMAHASDQRAVRQSRIPPESRGIMGLLSPSSPRGELHVAAELGDAAAATVEGGRQVRFQHRARTLSPVVPLIGRGVPAAPTARCRSVGWVPGAEPPVWHRVDDLGQMSLATSMGPA